MVVKQRHLPFGPGILVPFATEERFGCEGEKAARIRWKICSGPFVLLKKRLRLSDGPILPGVLS